MIMTIYRHGGDKIFKNEVGINGLQDFRHHGGDEIFKKVAYFF